MDPILSKISIEMVLGSIVALPLLLWKFYQKFNSDKNNQILEDSMTNFYKELVNELDHKRNEIESLKTIVSQQQRDIKLLSEEIEKLKEIINSNTLNNEVTVRKYLNVK